MKKKIKIIVLMGGKSPEHDVSIVTGTQVVKNLDSQKYDIFPVVISRDGGTWKLTDRFSLTKLSDTVGTYRKKKEIVLQNAKPVGGINEISGSSTDVVFIALHGPFGEDGTVQGLLELAGLKYTGSGVLSSAIGMDKIFFRKIMTADGIPIPLYTVVKRGENFNYINKILKNPPYFVKPHNQGSSVGASIVKRRGDLEKALKLAHKFSKFALVDEYIKGKEVTCAVLGNDKPFALPLVEIRPLKGDFFDYESKYTESGLEEIVPAKISKTLTKNVQETALKVYQSLGCKGSARVDFIIKNGKKPVVLEINTIPGLTPASLLPKAAKAAGMSYPELIDTIIKYAKED